VLPLVRSSAASTLVISRRGMTDRITMSIIKWSVAASLLVCSCVGSPQRTNVLYGDEHSVDGVVKLVGGHRHG
jgi:hypothetical protein